MKTSVLAYPRIGEKRELKRVTEEFFKGRISEEELEEKGRELRKKHWEIQKEKGIDFISSNDFSFYDIFLDTSCLLNVIPSEYLDENLSAKERYFAMARGHQDEEKGIDLKAMEMKKWFNTNYHYLVPNFEDSIEVKLNGTKIFDEYLEADKLGIKTKPVIIGPFTFLKLSKYRGEKKAEYFLNDILKVYSQIFEKLSNIGAEYIQVEEPYLVMDLEEQDKDFFNQIYDVLLGKKKNLKIILATYFGDIRDIYKDIVSRDFDAIALDFVEGKKNIELINKYSYPKDKLLFAGVVNGKNIWRNNYKDTKDLVEKLINLGLSIVINTSCSLLHVPYTLRNEEKMPLKYKEHLAFGEEKLVELRVLGDILESKEAEVQKAYLENQDLFERKGKLKDFSFDEINREISLLKEEDFIRNKNFEERIKLQRKRFELPLLPTTTIGSFPQTLEVRKVRRAYKNGTLSYDEYEVFMQNEIRKVVGLQEEIGLDVLVHGEFERNDMVEYFGENFEGFIFTQNGWVQSYGTRGVKPPVIFGDVRRPEPITVKWTKYAQSLTSKLVKGMLTGPVTIYNWSFPREDKSPREVIYQIALGIRDEVLDLERAGTKIIQIDEAALREKLPLRREDWKTYLDYTIKSFRLVQAKVQNLTQIHTHMCYSEFKDIMNEISQMDADVITIEAAKSDLSMLEVLKNENYTKEVGPGVYDIHSSRVPSKEEIEEIIERMIKLLGKDKLWVNPDCGLKTRGNLEVKEALKNMVEAAKSFR